MHRPSSRGVPAAPLLGFGFAIGIAVPFAVYMGSYVPMFLQGYDLSQAQVMMVRTLEEDDFDKLTPDNLAEYFSADAAVYMDWLAAQTSDAALARNPPATRSGSGNRAASVCVN